MDDKNYVSWIRRAEDDYNSACHLYNTLSKPSYEVICYLCQQTAEKVAKAIYISKFGIDNKLRTHDISSILKELPLDNNEAPVLISHANKLTQYAVSARYPTNIEYDISDAQKALTSASYLLEWGKRESMLQSKGQETERTFYGIKIYNYAFVMPEDNTINIKETFTVQAVEKPKDYTEDWSEGTVSCEFYDTQQELDNRIEEIQKLNR